MRIAKLYSFILLFILINRTNAQINTLAGYAYGYSDIPILSSIIDTFNARTPKLSSSMSHVNSTHGMELGLRYRLPIMSFEFSWANSFARVNNRSTASGTEVKNTLSFTKNTFIFGAELYFGRFGVGGSFDINTYKVKTSKPGFSPRDDVYSETGISNHLFISLELPVNERMSLSFRPYVQLPNRSFDFYQTAGHLNSETDANVNQFKNRIVTYGIKILFFNGEKNYDIDN
jgi:hypothetical protein